MKNQEELLILDGGTGREIERCGGPFRQPEWSALALYEDPTIVRQVHESYIKAGATAITTNTYAVVPFHLGTERYDKDGKRLLKLAVDLAVQAKGDRDDVLILGSIPPLCGSYEPDKFDEAIAGPLLQDFMSAFQDRVDVLLLETIGSIREATFYLETIRDSSSLSGIPVWISFCLKSKHGTDQHPELITGETLAHAIEELDGASLLPAVVLVNCCDIRLVGEALKELSKFPKLRLGAYPNAFSIPPPDAANHTLRKVDFNISPQVMREAARGWITQGATILGGCCGVSPEHIQAMSELLISQRTN
jgi:S-methylmethionine-dependent homocysteine/selenocysteine methylase